MLMSMEEFSFGQNDDKVGRKNTRFTAEKGRTYRFSFASWPSDDEGVFQFEGMNPKFKGAFTNWIDNVGYVLNNGPEFTKLAGKAPKRRIATIILVWGVNKEGKPEGQPSCYTWVFGEDKYTVLKNFATSDFPFSDWDLKVFLKPNKEAKFQDMDFIPVKGCLFRKIVESGKSSDIINEVKELISNIPNEIGREMSIEELRKAIQGPDQGSGGGSSDIEEVSVEDVDNLINNLVE